MTLEHGGLAVADFAHDLDGPMAIRAHGNLGARHVGDDPERSRAAAAFGGRGQGALTIRNFGLQEKQKPAYAK